jgi:hypothetical protein
MDPMGHESIKTRSADVSDEITRLSGCPSPVFSWRRENFSRTVTPRRDGEALNKWLVVKKPLMNLLQPKEKTPPRSHKTLKCRNLYLFERFWNHLGSIEYQGSGIHFESPGKF